jgi:hypothetical protein
MLISTQTAYGCPAMSSIRKEDLLLVLCTLELSPSITISFGRSSLPHGLLDSSVVYHLFTFAVTVAYLCLAGDAPRC